MDLNGCTRSRASHRNCSTICWSNRSATRSATPSAGGDREDPDPLPGFAQLGVLARGGSGLDAILDVGLLDPVRHARFADPEIGGDLRETLGS
nr:hypothetical protein [Nocardia rhizosphaerihabitans]